MFLAIFSIGFFRFIFHPLAPDGSYNMIHGSYGRNSRPGAKGLVDNGNFLFIENPIRR